MLFTAIQKAHTENGMDFKRIVEILRECGYELERKRVMGYSGNMYIQNAILEHNDHKRRGLTAEEIDSEMQFDRQLDEGEEEDYFHDIIDGKEFFDAAFTALRNSKVHCTIRKVGRQNVPKAMRLLGSPLASQ